MVSARCDLKKYHARTELNCLRLVFVFLTLSDTSGHHLHQEPRGWN